ncbi:MAG: glycosyltransferase family 4 protein [Reichenbachiella sp.]|uniref:glycosyltransferase family 4 protein n=1 Tax=Reichenbachiella sp. TaxID=2184521 RepID=UPI003265146E
MKVAITINTSWNVYNFRMGLIRELILGGNEVIAIAPEDRFSVKLEEAGCTFVPIQVENTGTNPIKDFLLFLQLRKIYRQYRPDIIFNFTVKPNIYGSLAARSTRIPVINNVSGLGTVFLSKGISSTIAKWLYRWSFSYAQLVFFQNNDDRQKFLSEISIPQLETDLLPGSGINLDSFQPTAYKLNQGKTFLMISRLIIEKGVLEFLEAAKMTRNKFPDAKFQLLGKLDSSHSRGISKETIDSATNSNIIEYLGETDDVKPYIENSACVVLPSYGEGTPRTLLEAAAMAKPIITTDVPGCREVVIDGETGLLCQAQNSADLAHKMMIIWEMPDNELELWGRNGRHMVETKFDEQIVIDRYLKHASNIMNQISYE